jgi:hypothetical protein
LGRIDAWLMRERERKRERALMMVGTDGRMAHVPSSNREWEYGRSHMLGPERPEAVLRDRAFCLPTFSHFLIVNKTSLSLSVCLRVGIFRCAIL